MRRNEQALPSGIDKETQYLTIWREHIATVVRIDSADAIELVLNKAKLFGENILCILNDSE